MRIESVVFGSNRHYERLARVLFVSAEANSPSVPVNVTQFFDQDREIVQYSRQPTYINNTRKTKHHRELVHEAADGEVLCLIDADTMVLRDIGDAESLDFDLAITMRPPGASFRFNSGVVFVRVSARTRRLYDDWFDVNMQMLRDPKLLGQYRGRYGGINQSSLGYLLEAGQADLKVHELTCVEWNSVRDTWAHFGPTTRIVHILGGLRAACLRTYKRTTDRHIAVLRDIWSGYDREASKLLAGGLR